MRSWILCTCIVFSPLITGVVTVVDALDRPGKRSILAIRGGARYLYEENPQYVNYSPQQPMLLQDLEPDHSHNIFNGGQVPEMRSGYFSVEPQRPTSFDGVKNSIQSYFMHLYATSPAVAQTLVACLGTFLLWQVSACRPLLGDFFVCSRRNLLAGRWPALLLSSISHTGLFHLVFNLMALVSIGVPLKQTLQLGNWPAWPLMVGGALSGSFSYLLLDRHSSGCIGLSSVTMSLLAVHAQLYPKSVMGFLLFGVFPVRIQAEKALRILLLWSVWGSWKGTRQRGVPIAHSAHLGGMLFGIAYHAAWLRRRDVGRLLHRAERVLQQRLRPLVTKSVGILSKMKK
jgi:membrane associated rhomboid family serine protease